MLIQVRIQNYALIDEIRIDFESGLNVLTGETGAGKSILIDALRLCLGDRADSIPFKNPAQPCILEAVIDYQSVQKMLGEKISKELFGEFLGEGDDMLVFKREFSAPGKSRNMINGRITNLSQIRELTARLVDWHGQYDFQSIFDSRAQLEMLDRYAKSEKILSEYGELYTEYAALKQAEADLLDSIRDRDAQMDLLKFQTQEIERIDPKHGEDVQLKSEWIRASHAEKINEKLTDILNKLDEGAESVSSQVGAAFRPLLDLEKIDPEFAKKREQLESLQSSLEELIREMRDYRDRLSFDEGSARDAETRLNALDLLKRKYGGSIESVCSFLDSAKKKLAQLEDSDLSLKELAKQIQTLLKRVRTVGVKLSEARTAAAVRFSKKIAVELAELGMKNAKFECQVSPAEPGPTGCDAVQFELAANVGLPAQPLARIASGGEASRVMLAIKKVAGDSDKISTLIFDEIDANIGGRLGSIVGQKLKEIAADHQVLLITHLPQIAAFSNCHLKVVKQVQGGKTKIAYETLDRAGRVKELAQMMSGQAETTISVKHARELLEAAGASV